MNPFPTSDRFQYRQNRGRRNRQACSLQGAVQKSCLALMQCEADGFLCSFRLGWRKYPYRQVRQFAIENREIMQVNSARVALPVGSRIPPVRPFMMPFTFAQRMAGTA